MITENMIKESRAKDIIPIFSGHEVCEKNHKFGPTTRNYYLIHFCLNGSGELIDKFGCHKITPGELFIIRPGEISTYIADSNTPWEYSWIAFGGSMADIFDTDQSIYLFPMEIGTSVCELSLNGINSPAIFISLIYELIFYLFSEKKENTDITEKIKQYVIFNYMNDISVLSISDYFHFERSYLYRIFKRSSGMGIKEYIVKTRMEQAKILLKNGYSVGNTALAVGYKEQSNFSKAFTKHFGTPPNEIKG